MHVFATVIEEINDKDDVLNELDVILFFVDIESSSHVYEEHVPLQQQVENHTILVAPKVVVDEHHEKDVEVLSSQKVEPLPN